MRRRWLLGALALLVFGRADRASAQAPIPNGVFLQDSRGFLWLVLDGKRVSIGVWPASDREIGAVPRSHRWAVMDEDGAIVAGDPPAWLTPGGDAPLSGQHPCP